MALSLGSRVVQSARAARKSLCRRYGEPLIAACTSCGHPLPRAALFCSSCGHRVSSMPDDLAAKILTSRGAIEGERKHVTVLFADVKSSIELVAERDPEDARTILDAVLKSMMEAVHRYEGTVNQVMGDGIMALFGAPIAHEDHALRACYAALAILKSMNRSLEVRIGLNSGAVIVRAIRSDLRMDYSAIGETTHLASRMEQLARPNTIYITETTYRLVDRFVTVEPLGPIAVKGLANPVSVFTLSGAHGPVEVGRLRSTGQQTRFVGRERELDLLHRALERSASGDARIVGIAGEAGIGKSRLCLEFAAQCRAQSVSVWHLGATPYGRAMPFTLLLYFLRRYFDIRDEDAPERVRAKVQTRLQEAVYQEPHDLPLLLDLLSASREERVQSADPTSRRDALLATLKRLVWQESRWRFSVFIFEDLHWLDSESNVLFEALVEAIRGASAMLIVNFRPPLHAEWMNRSYYERLSLSPLDHDAAAAVAAGLLGTDPSLRSVTAQILERAAGNVFFIEELTRSLVESGRLIGERGVYRWIPPTAAFELPATVTAVLASRIDRLSETDKDTLQTAAVVGREFSAKLLATVANQSEEAVRPILARLVATEFLVERPGIVGEIYAFRPPLIQEVAYQSQLRDRRRRLHAAIAQALHTIHRERLNEHAALLCFHVEAAGDLRAAATSAARAAQWIGFRNAEAAIAYWTKARNLLTPHDSDPDTWGP